MGRSIKPNKRVKSHKVFIRGRAWKLILIRDEEFPLFHDDITAESAPYGLCDPSTETILLNKSFPLQAVKDTLMHEVGHAIFSIVSGSKESMEGNLSEEVACNLLGYALPEIFPQYAGILKFIETEYSK